jgi:heme/copper-type cytochrome/quinol oxidase subunit 3
MKKRNLVIALLIATIIISLFSIVMTLYEWKDYTYGKGNSLENEAQLKIYIEKPSLENEVSEEWN